MYQKFIAVARLVADPELRTTEKGTPVASFRVAVDRPYTKKGEDKKSDFFNCVAWRGNGEFVSKYFHKGDVIGIEGTFQNREYTDKEGNKRYATDCVVDRAFFVGGKSSGGAATGNEAEPNATAQAAVPNSADVPVDIDEDLPF